MTESDNRVTSSTVPLPPAIMLHCRWISVREAAARSLDGDPQLLSATTIPQSAVFGLPQSISALLARLWRRSACLAIVHDLFASTRFEPTASHTATSSTLSARMLDRASLCHTLHFVSVHVTEVQA